MPDEPTLGEVVRRLADITTQLAAISHQLRTDFVRKEVYEVQMAGVRKDVSDIETARSDDQKWRRTAGLAVAVGAVGWLLTIIGLVVAVAMKVT